MKKFVISLIALLLLIPLLPATFAADVVGIQGPALKTTTTSYNAPEAGNIRMIQAKYDPYPAEPGQYVTVWMSVQNWGDKDITDAYFKIKPEYPLTVKPGEDEIKETGIISTLKERLLEWDLYVNQDAIEGNYKVELILCSDSTCSQELKTSTSEITVKTGGTPRIKIGLESMPNLASGMSGEITLNVVNRGNLDTKYMAMTLLPSDKYEILSPQEVYIGALDSDSFETATFKLFIRNGVAATSSEYIELPVKVDYTDSNNKDYSEESMVKMRVYSLADMKQFGLAGKGNGYFAMAGIAAIVILAIVLWRIKKKRKKD
jgi:hypothetical protein